MSTLKIWMPAGVRKYKVWLDTGVRKILRYLPTAVGCEPCLTPNFVPAPNDFTTWSVTGGVLIVSDNVNCPSGVEQTADSINLPSGASEMEHPLVGGLTPDQATNFSVWIYPNIPRVLVLENSAGAAFGSMEIDFTVLPLTQWHNFAVGQPQVTLNNVFVTNGSGQIQFKFKIKGQTGNFVFDAWCMRGWQ